MVSKNSKFVTILGLIFALVVTAYAADSRTKLKPGWNLFSPQQDIEMGRESAKQAEMQLPILNDRQATSYIDTLGKQLASHAPGEKYPYQFKIVNDTAINAFALPGGFIYVNRGAIEAADSENQIAGVMAHEIGHVVLRHGTNQVSKAYLAQAARLQTPGRIPRSFIRRRIFWPDCPLLLKVREERTVLPIHEMGSRRRHRAAWQPLVETACSSGIPTTGVSMGREARRRLRRTAAL